MPASTIKTPSPATRLRSSVDRTDRTANSRAFRCILPDWLLKLQHIALEPLLISGTLAVALWLFITLKLPRPERKVGAAVTLCFLVIAQSRSDQYRLIPDPIMDVGSWWTFLTLAGVAVASFITTKAFPVDRLRISRWDEHRANRVFVSTAGIAFVLSLVLPPAANALLGPLALLVFLSLLAWLSREKNLGRFSR